MNKTNGITALASIGGMVIGGCVGAVTGLIHGPLTVALALTAPVSYPLVGMCTGLVQDQFSTQRQSAAVGLAVGTCFIPFAPVALAMAPFAVPIHVVTGMLGGGVGAGLLTHEHLNNKEK